MKMKSARQMDLGGIQNFRQFLGQKALRSE
jgi:hypothetical protein